MLKKSNRKTRVEISLLQRHTARFSVQALQALDSSQSQAKPSEANAGDNNGSEKKTKIFMSGYGYGHLFFYLFFVCSILFAARALACKDRFWQ